MPKGNSHGPIKVNQIVILQQVQRNRCVEHPIFPFKVGITFVAFCDIAHGVSPDSVSRVFRGEELLPIPYRAAGTGIVHGNRDGGHLVLLDQNADKGIAGLCFAGFEGIFQKISDQNAKVGFRDEQLFRQIDFECHGNGILFCLVCIIGKNGI